MKQYYFLVRNPFDGEYIVDDYHVMDGPDPNRDDKHAILRLVSRAASEPDVLDQIFSVRSIEPMTRVELQVLIKMEIRYNGVSHFLKSYSLGKLAEGPFSLIFKSMRGQIEMGSA